MEKKLIITRKVIPDMDKTSSYLTWIKYVQGENPTPTIRNNTLWFIPALFSFRSF